LNIEDWALNIGYFQKRLTRARTGRTEKTFRLLPSTFYLLVKIAVPEAVNL
jgi:hypothetical protein